MNTEKINRLRKELGNHGLGLEECEKSETGETLYRLPDFKTGLHAASKLLLRQVEEGIERLNAFGPIKRAD